MTGVSDLPFRRLVKRYGAGLVVSEMIASRAMVLETRNTLRMAKHTPEEFPMAVQLAGCEPEVMAEAAKLNEDRGATIIDINFGCPVKKVTNGEAGSALLRNEPLAAKILEATVKAVKIPVTLKMRMGWDHNSLNAPKMAKIAEESGIKMITVHGRTRQQFYKGSADCQAFFILCERCGEAPCHCQRRYHYLRGCGQGDDRIRRGRGDDRPRQLRQAMVYRAGDRVFER